MNENGLGDLEPRQSRSRATRRRLLASVNHLLRQRPLESLSVHEISSQAGCSIGAFYGRFRSKDQLLAPLLERHYASMLRGLRQASARSNWRTMPLEDRLAWMTRMVVWVFRSRRWLLRALTVFVRQYSENVELSQRAARVEFMIAARELLVDVSDEIPHPDRSEAFDFALLLITTVCRERVLFGELGNNAGIGANDEALVAEIARATHAYLTGATVPRGLWMGA